MYLIKGTLYGHTDTFKACDSLSQARTLKEHYTQSYGNSWTFSIELR